MFGLTKSKHPGIPTKYIALRNEFKTGDIVLYRGSSVLAKSIQYFDNAYYNHIGIVYKVDGLDRLLTLDMWSDGLELLPLSRRMDGYSDFCIMRPIHDETIKISVIKNIMEQWEEKDIEYDMFLLPRVALIKSCGIDITGLGKSNKYICSEFVQHYTDMLNISCFTDHKLITPEDFRRYKNDDTTLMYDEAPEPKTSARKKIFGREYNI